MIPSNTVTEKIATYSAPSSTIDAQTIQTRDDKSNLEGLTRQSLENAQKHDLASEKQGFNSTDSSGLILEALEDSHKSVVSIRGSVVAHDLDTIGSDASQVDYGQDIEPVAVDDKNTLWDI